MAELFQKNVRTINEHIQNIFDEGELAPESVIRKFRITADDGKRYDTQPYKFMAGTGATIKNGQKHWLGQARGPAPTMTGRWGDGMTFDFDGRRRRSIRLRGYDYSQDGAYFITICTQNRECMFGEIADGKMVMNLAGNMIQTVWDEIPFHYAGIEIDEFVVMPNHVHGIIVIVGATPCGCPVLTPRGCPVVPGPGVGQARGLGQARGPAPTGDAGDMGRLSLGDMVHRFKTITTKRYADGVKQWGWPSFPGKLWQRNYWEHIVRNEIELNRIREYIHTNPTQWESDRLNLVERKTGGPTMVREPVFSYPTEGWMV